MKQNFAKLIKTKTIISLVSTGVFSYLAIVGKIDSKDFMMIFAMIITYFFNKDTKEVG